MVAGLPGSGKSTLARKLARKYKLEHISTDSVRKRIFKKVMPAEFGKGSYNEDLRMAVYDTIFFLLYTLLKHNIGCVLDGTFYKEALRTKVKRICYRFNAKFLLIIVKSPETLIANRFKERERSTHRRLSDADYEIYKKYKSLYQPTKLDHLEIDATQESAEILKMIDNAIKKSDYPKTHKK
ncbi:MAG: AAA family ATPase [Candidatus Heimdallarchaeaceae archaeon]